MSIHPQHQIFANEYGVKPENLTEEQDEICKAWAFSQIPEYTIREYIQYKRNREHDNEEVQKERDRQRVYQRFIDDSVRNLPRRWELVVRAQIRSAIEESWPSNPMCFATENSRWNQHLIQHRLRDHQKFSLVISRQRFLVQTARINMARDGNIDKLTQHNKKRTSSSPDVNLSNEKYESKQLSMRLGTRRLEGFNKGAQRAIDLSESKESPTKTP